MNGLDADNYPHLPVVESHNQMKLPVHVLTKLINETVFAVSQHESRPILTGVHFILSDHSLLAVATDSHRLSQRVIPVEQTADHFDIVIPGKSLIELSRSLTNEEEIVEVTDAPIDHKNMLVLAVATSIDALAVGITFAFLNTPIIEAISIIGITTFVLSIIGVIVGNFFGSKYKSKAEFIGGLILVLLGVKILLEHLGILAF